MYESGKPVLLHGNEACAYGALAAGAEFFAGYPITPSSEIAEVLARELPLRGGKFIQMEDEMGGIAAALGASLTGKKAITASSGPGISLKMENIGFGCMAEIPVVIVDVQRGGPSTGLPTKVSQGDLMQVRWGTHGDHPVIALAPSTVEECFYFTVDAFNLAERFRTPVFLMMDEVLGHMRERVVLPEKVETVERKRPSVPPEEYHPYEYTEDCIPPMADFGSGYRYHVTGLFHDRTGFPTNDPAEIERAMHRLMAKIDKHRAGIVRSETVEVDDARVLIVALGSVARSARQAVAELRERSVAVGLFRPVTVWPFPGEHLVPLLEKCAPEAVLVAELNMGQMVLEVERLVAGRCPVHFLGRVDGELMTPEQIEEEVERIVGGGMR